MPLIRKTNNLATVKLNLQALAGKQGKVGWFETAKYEDGTPVAFVAQIHEFGAPGAGIPARPFFRPTVERERRSWADIALRGAGAVIQGKVPVAAVFEAIGLRAAGDVARSISQVVAPPLKLATVKARLRHRASKAVTKSITKPLIDSGLMMATVSNKVEDA